jgi:hypothetical protein
MSNNINILEFLSKLHANLEMSINSFQEINKNKISNLETLYDLIQQNNRKMYKYLNCLKQLELLYFTNDSNFQDENQFIHAFDMDPDLYNKNFKKSFKDDIKISVNLHKLKKASRNKVLAPNETKTINLVESINISPNNLNLPVIKNLKDMSPVFHWYNGDNFYKKGIYICLAPGFYSRVPFPNLFSASHPNFKNNSIPCKFETLENCTNHKKKISEIYNSDVRECTYVHKKEKFAKIGSFYRCNRESFGNHESLTTDMDFINISDIKRILMHSLSDSLLTVLWYQNKFKDGNLFLNNIDTF